MNEPEIKSFDNASLRGVPEGRRSNPLRLSRISTDCSVAPSSLLAMTFLKKLIKSIPKHAILASLFIASLISCKSKTGLDPEEAKYVRTALDLIRVRAEFSAEIGARKKDSLAKDSTAIDSVRFNASLDSVYRRDGINRQQFIDWTTSLAQDPKRAAAFYGALNDSMSGK